MSQERPTLFPRYSSVPTGNGPDGQLNFSEPSEAKKDQGHDFGEFPPRETMNWIHKLSYEWFKHLHESTGRRNLRFFNSQVQE